MCSALPTWMTDTQTMDDRFVELETRLAFQEEYIEGLSRTVSRQQQIIDALRRELDELRQRLQALPARPWEPQGEETPPHY